MAAYLANTDNELAEDGVIAPKYVGAILMFFFFPNGRYIDCSSLTYETKKSKTLKLQYRY